MVTACGGWGAGPTAVFPPRRAAVTRPASPSRARGAQGGGRECPSPPAMPHRASGRLRRPPPLRVLGWDGPAAPAGRRGPPPHPGPGARMVRPAAGLLGVTAARARMVARRPSRPALLPRGSPTEPTRIPRAPSRPVPRRCGRGASRATRSAGCARDSDTPGRIGGIMVPGSLQRGRAPPWPRQHLPRRPAATGAG
jgi:hypothetical protein